LITTEILTYFDNFRAILSVDANSVQLVQQRILYASSGKSFRRTPGVAQ